MQEKRLKISPIKARIFQYIKYKGVTKVSFYANTGISSANFKGIGAKSEIGGENIAKILTFFEDLNAEWLILGTGNMTKNAQKSPDPELSEPIPSYSKHCHACAEKERIIRAKTELIEAKTETINSLKLIIERSNNQASSKRSAS